jgi:hypothetical protein
VNNYRVWSIYAQLRLSLTALAQEEKAFALPLVLAVLVIGSMIVTPFLTHAGANLTSSKVYADMSREKYAADSGIEQAIWDLKYGTLASRLNTAGGTLSYTLTNQLNNIAPVMTVTESGLGGGGGAAAGMITQPYTSRYQFDTAGYNPVMVNARGDIYAIAYRDASSPPHLMLKTVNITAGGAITQSTLSTLTVDTTGYDPNIIKIADGIIAIVYRGASNKGYIATLQIAANGTINGTPVAKVTYNTSNNYEPKIINVSGDYYLVAYRGSSNKGYVQTLQITAAGSITNSQVSLYNFSVTCYEPSIINISGNYFGVAYRSSSNLGYLTTLRVDNLGAITQSVISSQVFSSTTAYTPEIQNTSSGIFGIVYRGTTSNRGYITTLAVNSNGIISMPVLSTFVFDTTLGWEPYFRNISATAFALFYRGANNDGYIKTLEIASNGTINTTAIDSYRFDVSNGYEPYFIYISGNTYAAVYRGGTGGIIGYVITFQIATDNNVIYQIQAVAGATTVTTGLTLNSGVVQILNWDITR